MQAGVVCVHHSLHGLCDLRRPLSENRRQSAHEAPSYTGQTHWGVRVHANAEVGDTAGQGQEAAVVRRDLGFGEYLRYLAAGS